MRDVSGRRVVASRFVRHADRAAENPDVGLVCQPGDVHDRAVTDASRPLGGGVGERPVASSAVDFVKDRERERDTVASLAEELHERLRRVGENRRCLRVRRFGDTGIGAEIAKSGRPAGPPT